MKRELAAAVLLLILIGGAVFNVHVADCVTETVERSLHRAEAAAERGDYSTALTALQNGLDVWEGKKNYVHMFFRHPDIDAIYDAFTELEQKFLEGEESWPAAFRRLRYHLQSITYMEHVSFGTVF